MKSRLLLSAFAGATLCAAAMTPVPVFAAQADALIKLDGVKDGKISEADCKAKHGAVTKQSDGKHCSLPPAARAAMESHQGESSQTPKGN
jgi:hypothetical protein